VTAFDILQD